MVPHHSHVSTRYRLFAKRREKALGAEVRRSRPNGSMRDSSSDIRSQLSACITSRMTMIAFALAIDDSFGLYHMGDNAADDTKIYPRTMHGKIFRNS